MTKKQHNTSGLIKPVKMMGFIAICFFLLSSCNDYLDIDATSTASEENRWQDITDSRSSLIGIYGLLRAALANENAYYAYGDLRANEFKVMNRTDLSAITQNNLDAPYESLRELRNWKRFYAAINAASVFIENAPEVAKNDPRYSEDNLVIDLAQARALRAFAYFYMVRIWGDLPLLTSSYDNGSFKEFPRVPQESILKFAKNELLAVADDLPYQYGVGQQDYYGEPNSYWQGMLLTKLSAYTILAHIAAWNQNYLDAETYAKFVMDNAEQANATYSSIATLTGTNGIFSGRKASRIVSFGFFDEGNESSVNGHLESWTLAQPLISKEVPEIFIPKDSIISIFDFPYDLRFGIDTISKVYYKNYFATFSENTPVFSKIKVIRDGVSEGDFHVYSSAITFSRLEEITLLRAEALAALGMEMDAVPLLNIVRTSRNLPIFRLDRDEVDLIDAIFQERRRELMGEGWRWFDMVRHNRLKYKNGFIRELIKNEGIYWPIADEVLRNNSMINQNSYWE